MQPIHITHFSLMCKSDDLFYYNNALSRSDDNITYYLFQYDCGFTGINHMSIFIILTDGKYV